MNTISLMTAARLSCRLGLVCALVLSVGCGAESETTPTGDAGADAVASPDMTSPDTASPDNAAANPPDVGDAGMSSPPTTAVDAMETGPSPFPGPVDASVETAVVEAMAGPPLMGPAAFIGTWKYTGTRVFECETDPKPEAASGTLQIRAGTDAPIVVVRQCDVKHDVNGNVATLRPNQVCRFTNAGYSVSVAYMTSTLTLGEDGTIKWKEAWSGMLDSVKCTQTLEATLKR